MTLEEAMNFVDFLVYGLAQPIHDLQYVGCTLTKILTVTYHNDWYTQKIVDAQREKYGRVTWVGPACFFASSKGSTREYEMLISPPPPDPRHTFVAVQGLVGGAANDPLQGVQPTLLNREEIIIDGTHFVGYGKHYGYPFFYSSIYLKSAQTCLSVYFYGPNLEEVFDILQALRVLNEKK
jgi:hypothetical protein